MLRPERLTTRFFLRLSLSVVLSLSSLAADRQPEAVAYSERGLELARAGNLVLAEEQLRKAVALQPSDPEFLSRLGTVLAMQRKLEESTDVLAKALKFAPRDLTVRRNLAANLWQLRRYSEARAHLDKVLMQKPNDASTRLLRGMVAENMQDYPTAVRMLASVPEQVRQQPESIAALARAYYHVGQREKARGMLKYLTGHSTGAQAVLLGAQVADQMHDYSIAEQMLASIQSAFPDPALVGYSLALVQYHEEHFDECRAILLRLIDERHATGEIYNLLAWSYQKQNRDHEAIQALEEAIRLAPSQEANHVDLLRMLLAQQRPTLALEAAKKAIQVSPESSAILFLKGAAETQMGQFSDAIASYARAGELDPTNPGAVLGLAAAQYSGGMSKEAADTYERALKRFPKDAEFLLQYAIMLLKESEVGSLHTSGRAAQLLNRSLQLDPKLARTHYEIGSLALKQGKVAEAIKSLERSVKLDPDSAEAHFALSRAYRRLRRSADASREMELYSRLKSGTDASHVQPQ